MLPDRTGRPSSIMTGVRSLHFQRVRFSDERSLGEEGEALDLNEKEGEVMSRVLADRTGRPYNTMTAIYSLNISRHVNILDETERFTCTQRKRR